MYLPAANLLKNNIFFCRSGCQGLVRGSFRRLAEAMGLAALAPRAKLMP
jgi:hypothetical protein